MSSFSDVLTGSNLLILFGALVALVLLKSALVYVPNNRVGIKERLWSPKGSVKGGIIALNGEAGFEPEMLRGGFHLLVPFMYRVHKKNLVFVPQSEIGYVFARDGIPLPPGQTLGSSVEGQSFEDVRGFLQAAGNKGPQRRILREGLYAINTAQFVVLVDNEVYALRLAESDFEAIRAMQTLIKERDGFRPLMIDSRNDVLGVVTVHDGPPLPVGELIAPVVGQKTDGHSTHASFQEPDRFIQSAGYRGRQQQVLVDGTYYLNRLFATVDIIPKTVVSIGNVGVVISYTGRKGTDLSGEDYQHGELVLEGERGVWERPLLPGKYPFNTYAGKVIEVPTTNFILKWQAGEQGSKFDENLKEISLITRDAFEPTLPLSVVVHIDYKKASRVIQRFGNIQQLVEQTLDPMVSAYFKNTAQTKTLIELLQERADIQKRALEDMREKFAAYNLELQEVLIGTPQSPAGDRQIETILTQLRDRQIAREKLETYQRQEEAATRERSLREAEAVAAQQRTLTESKIAIGIAENNGLAEVNRQSNQGRAEAAKIRAVAQAEGDKIVAIGTANARRIELEGAATATAARQQVDAFGGPQIRLAQEIATAITKAIAEARLQVVPNVVVGGDGKGANAVDAIAALVLAGQGAAATALNGRHGGE
ncbi:MAG TPA: SPFH domain-containing protein [Burkholderiaceae bacterium]|nr:SPFH domain-containing protein [Burkholderiaceae bacterium]